MATYCVVLAARGREVYFPVEWDESVVAESEVDQRLLRRQVSLAAAWADRLGNYSAARLTFRKWDGPPKGNPGRVLLDLALPARPPALSAWQTADIDRKIAALRK